jgi:hypothetical protein
MLHRRHRRCRGDRRACAIAVGFAWRRRDGLWWQGFGKVAPDSANESVFDVNECRDAERDYNEAFRDYGEEHHREREDECGVGGDGLANEIATRHFGMGAELSVGHPECDGCGEKGHHREENSQAADTAVIPGGGEQGQQAGECKKRTACGRDGGPGGAWQLWEAASRRCR